MEERKRPRRRVLGVPRQKLAVQRECQREGYHLRWFNDEGTRIHDALSSGYEHVLWNRIQFKDTDPESKGAGKKVHVVVGKAEDGRPIHGYLMEIKMEYYKEDQAIKMAEIDKVDNEIREGRFGDQKEAGSRYNAGIKME